MGPDVNEDWAEKVTLLIQGYLIDKVADKANGRSRKVLAAHGSRLGGRHVHVVDGEGFTALLHGQPAQCLRIVDEGDRLRLSRPHAPTPPTVMGGRWKPRTTPSHPSTHLGLDLSALDVGTAAHERTTQLLHQFWEDRNISTRTTGPGMPPFDLCWEMPDGRVYIAVVKSITGTHEAQQVRLAIGQVLDYLDTVSRLMGTAGPAIGGVIALEREPAGLRWYDVTRRAGITLVCSPNFRPQPAASSSRTVERGMR